MKKARIRQGQFTVLLREEEDGGYSAVSGAARSNK